MHLEHTAKERRTRVIMHGMDEVLDNGGEEQVLQIGHKETELQT
jgi:hypothetical protein